MIEFLILAALGLWVGVKLFAFCVDYAAAIFILGVIAAGIAGVVYLI